MYENITKVYKQQNILKYQTQMPLSVKLKIYRQSTLILFQHIYESHVARHLYGRRVAGCYGEPLT